MGGWGGGGGGKKKGIEEGQGKYAFYGVSVIFLKKEKGKKKKQKHYFLETFTTRDK
jgi:hypothetical protein